MINGAVAFPFTDIEGITQRWEQHPEVMKAAQAARQAIAHALQDE